MKRILAVVLCFALYITLTIPCSAYDENLVISKDFSYGTWDFSEGYAKISDISGATTQYGFIDNNGNIAIPLTDEYSSMGDVHDGLILVCKKTEGGGEKYGFINTRGEIIIPIEYDYAADFREGLAAVGRDYITGKEEVPDAFKDQLGEYINTYATAYGFIDTAGNEVIPLIYDDITGFESAFPSYITMTPSLEKDESGFFEGLACVKKDGKYGAIDKDGNVVIPFVHTSMCPFSDGLALVSNGYKYGFIDHEGNYAFQLVYDSARTFRNGMTIVTQNGTTMAMSTTGTLSCALNYYRIFDYSEGYAVVANKTGEDSYKCGYIDTKGNLITPMVYDTASNFSCGLANVGISDTRFDSRFICKEGYIDSTGNIVVPLEYDYASDFSEGLAVVAYNAGNSGVNYGGSPMYGFIDTTGKAVIPLDLRYAESFNDGIAFIRDKSNHKALIRNPFPEAEADTGFFSDVKESDYFYDAVLWAIDSDMLDTDKAKLNPHEIAPRAEIVEYIWKYSGSPEPTINNPFTDVYPGDSYYKAVLWAYENGITTGTTETEFSPNALCTRAQTVTFIWRALGEPEATPTSKFSDVKTDVYYTIPVSYAVEQGITTGTTDITFSPANSCTRAQILTFLYRSLKSETPGAGNWETGSDDENNDGANIAQGAGDMDGLGQYNPEYDANDDYTISGWDDYEGEKEGYDYIPGFGYFPQGNANFDVEDFGIDFNDVVNP